MEQKWAYLVKIQARKGNMEAVDQFQDATRTKNNERETNRIE